tara:strand:+ start:57 stop:305 length:249 start_codon:yes stop_codon:yes gene_type:complete
MFYKGDAKRRRLNKIGLFVSTAYLALGLFLKHVAYQKIAEQLDAQGISYSTISLRPAPLNTILWNSQYRYQRKLFDWRLFIF